jgi:hypothetical protein
MRLAATADTLVWTDTAAGRVMTMPAAGGKPVPISGSETTAPTLLAVNGTTIFWLDGKTIHKRAGGAVSDVYTNLDEVHGLATSDDGATVYFSTGQKVQSVTAAGSGAPVDVEVHTRGAPAALAVSGATLASTVSDLGIVDVIRLGGPIARCSTADIPDPTNPDVACNRVACCQGSLDGVLATSASKVVWADGYGLKMGDLVVDGADHPWDHITDADAAVASMVVANGLIYFNTSDPTTPDFNVVAKSPMTASAPRPLRLARRITTNVPGSLVVVGNAVFWATSDCGIQAVPAGEAP